MIKIFKYVIFIAVIAVAAALLYFRLGDSKTSIEVSKGQVRDIKTMVQLCSIDLYNEVPVRDTINNKVIFAIQKQRGSISFDMENLTVDADGDTVKILLPPEIIEINEATEDNSWQVIDTKNIGFLGGLKSSRLSDDEENRVKARIKAKSKRLLYQNGTVKRARAEASKNLQSLMEKIYRKPVVVNDPTPNGSY